MNPQVALMGHQSPPSGPIQRQIHPLHALLSLYKIHFKNILPCKAVVMFLHQLTFIPDEVLHVCGRRLAFHDTNLASTTQKYLENLRSDVRCIIAFVVLHEIYIPFTFSIDILTWPYSSLLGCYLQGFWFRLPQNISGRDVECGGRAAAGRGRVFVWPLQSIQ
jgi:hypothetical protein